MHTSVSTSHKNFSLDSLSSIAWCRTRNCVVLNFYKEPVSSRIVNYGRYFLYGKSKMRSSFIRSVCLLCRFVKIAVQRHGYLNLHEAFPFPSEYSVNTSYIHIYIYTDKKRCSLDRVSVIHFLNMFILCRLCVSRNVARKHSSFE